MAINFDFLTKVLQFKYSSNNFQISDYKLDFMQEQEQENSKIFKVLVNYTQNGTSISSKLMAHIISEKQQKSKNILSNFALVKSFQTYLKEQFNSPFLNYVYSENNLVLYEEEPNYEFVKVLQVTHVKAALASLAKWHANSLNLENSAFQDHVDLLTSQENPNQEEQSEFDVVSATVKGLYFLLETVDTIRDKLRDLREALEKYLMEYQCLISPNCNRFKNVCCIGKFDSSNLLFKCENEEPLDCKFLNLQEIKIAPPVSDALLLLYTNLSDDDRRNHMQGLLEFYYNILKIEVQNLDQKFPLLEFVETCKSYEKAINFMRITQETFKILHENPPKSTVTMMAQMCILKEDTYKMALLDQKLDELRVLLLKSNILSTDDLHNLAKQKMGSKEFQMVKNKIEPYASRCGILGDHYNLKIKVMVDGKKEALRFFVKTLPEMEASRVMAIKSGACFKEFRMFKRLVPDLKALGVNLLDQIIPECYLAKLFNVMVFEELKSDGLISLSSRVPLSYECVKLVASAMAKLHASVIIYEEKMTVDKSAPFRIIEHYEEEFRESFFSHTECARKILESGKKGAKTHLELFREDLVDVDFDKFTEMVLQQFEKIYEWVKPSQTHRNTICHGDLWVNNLLFKFDGKTPVGCKIVDFQSYRYCNPAHDLMSFLYLSTDRLFRQEHLSKVLDYYYVEFQQNLADFLIDLDEVLKYSEFIKSCEEMKAYGMTLAMAWNHGGKQDPEDLGRIMNDKEKAEKFINVDRSDVIREVCGRDPVYKAILRESVLDFKDLYKEMYN